MNPVAIDTDAFLRAQVAATYHFSDGAAHNGTAMWWRLNFPEPGTTWTVTYNDDTPGGPAVVDDFGNLVLAGVRS
jgi:hypothetical protein